MKYRTIVADPPWPYNDGFVTMPTSPHKKAREQGALTDTPIVRRQIPYQTLHVDEIAELPVSSLAARDARLFLWTTSRHVPDALAICEAWEFKYRQLLVWDKTPNFNPVAGGVAAIATEFVLVAQRGTPGMLSRWPTSIIRGRKPRAEHSVKPDGFLDIVETISPGPYLELFARRQRLGWDTWGNEALQHVDLKVGA